jgi:uncharacterized membrane protein
MSNDVNNNGRIIQTISPRLPEGEPASPGHRIRTSFRRTFVAGLFTFIPIVITIVIIWWIEVHVRPIVKYLSRDWIDVPFVGVLLALIAIYFTGVLTTSLLGKMFFKVIDAILLRLPIVRQVYLGWKQIAFTPGGTEGTFSKVVLVPDESGTMKLMGFTSGRIIEASEPCLCVFVPSAPNPITGRLYFVPVGKCQVIDMSPEEAFKVVLSNGNYVPPLTPLEIMKF